MTKFLSLFEDLDQFIGRDDQFWGITGDEDSEFENGYSGVVCTGYAKTIADRLPDRARVMGFNVHDNPTATGMADLADGHDFAVIDDRWIVDPWLSDVEAASEQGIFDLENEADAEAIARWYGDRSAWRPMTEASSNQ